MNSLCSQSIYLRVRGRRCGQFQTRWCSTKVALQKKKKREVGSGSSKEWCFHLFCSTKALEDTERNKEHTHTEKKKTKTGKKNTASLFASVSFVFLATRTPARKHRGET